MQLLTTFNRIMNTIICQVLVAMFTLMVVVIFLQVIFRYVFNAPLAWSEEVGRYLFIWTTFMGASVGFYYNKHIRVVALTEFMKNIRCRSAILLLCDIICLIFIGLFFTEGARVTYRVWSMGQVGNAATWLPIGLVYLSIPLSSFFMVLNVLVYAIINCRMMITGKEIEPPVAPA